MQARDKKHINLDLLVEAEEDDEADGDEELKEVHRKVESIVWEKGKGDSYVAIACDIRRPYGSKQAR